MGESEERRDVFKLSRDWLSVQEVVDAVSSSSCGAISVFIGLYFIYFHQQKYSNVIIYIILVCVCVCVCVCAQVRPGRMSWMAGR